MRINAGKYKSRNIEITNLETTRETSDKVRQAIFNLIGQFFDGGIALDLFAGSGAMGIESYSRGIDTVYFNDLNSKALEIVKKNCKSLGCFSDMHFLNFDYKTALENLKDKKFDLIFLDPPYAIVNVDEIIKYISDNNMLNENGILSFEMHYETICSDKIGKYVKIKDKKYGIKRVVIYRGSE